MYALPPRAAWTALCLQSRRDHAYVDHVFRGWSMCRVNTASIACRKSQLGSYDLYVVLCTEHLVEAAVFFWREIRTFDPATPFLFVTHRPIELRHAERLRAFHDAAIQVSAGATQARASIAALLYHAAERSLAARTQVLWQLKAALRQRLALHGTSTGLSPHSLARAQEHVLRHAALNHFMAAGGNKAWFDVLWPDMFDDALQAFYAYMTALDPANPHRQRSRPPPPPPRDEYGAAADR